MDVRIPTLDQIFVDPTTGEASLLIAVTGSTHDVASFTNVLRSDPRTRVRVFIRFDRHALVEVAGPESCLRDVISLFAPSSTSPVSTVSMCAETVIIRTVVTARPRRRRLIWSRLRRSTSVVG